MITIVYTSTVSAEFLQPDLLGSLEKDVIASLKEKLLNSDFNVESLQATTNPNLDSDVRIVSLVISAFPKENLPSSTTTI